MQKRTSIEKMKIEIIYNCYCIYAAKVNAQIALSKRRIERFLKTVKKGDK